MWAKVSGENPFAPVFGSVLNWTEHSLRAQSGQGRLWTGVRKVTKLTNQRTIHGFENNTNFLYCFSSFFLQLFASGLESRFRTANETTVTVQLV